MGFTRICREDLASRTNSSDWEIVSSADWYYVPDAKVDLLFSPLILTTNLILLIRREVVLDVECLADLFWGFALDHICDSLAANVEESLDIEVIGGLKAAEILAKILRGYNEAMLNNIIELTRIISKSIS